MNAHDLLNAVNIILNVVMIGLFLVLFNYLGMFRRKTAAQPAKAEPEILTWSPIDDYARSLQTITVQDDVGNLAHARFSYPRNRWEFACNGNELPFIPTKYRSSHHRWQRFSACAYRPRSLYR